MALIYPIVEFAIAVLRDGKQSSEAIRECRERIRTLSVIARGIDSGEALLSKRGTETPIQRAARIGGKRWHR